VKSPENHSQILKIFTSNSNMSLYPLSPPLICARHSSIAAAAAAGRSRAAAAASCCCSSFGRNSPPPERDGVGLRDTVECDSADFDAGGAR